MARPERQVIKEYASFFSPIRNQDIRAGRLENMNDESGRTVGEVMNLVNSALSKLPDYEGVTFRGVQFGNPQSVPAELLQEGSTYVDRGFMSTSRKPSGAFDAFSTDSSVFMVILSKHGKSIEKLTPNEMRHEREVLFCTGTKMRVEISVQLDRRGARIVFLREI